MKNNDSSKKFLAFVLGTAAVSVLSFISTSKAQNPYVKLVMRLGEERVLEDGTKVGVSKGEGDLIVVTLSKAAPLRSSGPSARSSQLKPGLYKIRAKQSSESVYGGPPIEQYVAVSLRIEGVDTNGEVTARLSLGIEEGQLKGRVNENGTLLLDGLLTSKAVGESKFHLKATVEGDTLINGTYLQIRTRSNTETKGVFSVGRWDEGP
jgi:hypothetical protein